MDRYTHLYQTRIRNLQSKSARAKLPPNQGSHTDVDYVALSVDHNISVVPILDLKDITSNGVRSHRLDEVQPGLLECNRMFSTVFSDEEIEQVIDFGPSHLISRC